MQALEWCATATSFPGRNERDKRISLDALPREVSSRCLGIPGQVLAITDKDRYLAQVDVGGVLGEVTIACILDREHPAGACVGDWVLIHAGYAVSRISPQTAAQTLAILDEIADMSEE